MCTNAYKEGKSGLGFQPAFRSSMVLLFGAYTLVFIASIGTVFAQQRDISVTCTNPHSGVTWQIRIDYDHGTVDANPARISDREISWRDRDGANYTLDRKSGNLTVIIASSTGGFFLHDRCKLEN